MDTNLVFQGMHQVQGHYSLIMEMGNGKQNSIWWTYLTLMIGLDLMA